MDVLRLLTRKFRAQAINDKRQSTSGGVGNAAAASAAATAAARLPPSTEEDTLDSGTASDEEILRVLPEGLLRHRHHHAATGRASRYYTGGGQSDDPSTSRIECNQEKTNSSLSFSSSSSSSSSNSDKYGPALPMSERDDTPPSPSRAVPSALGGAVEPERDQEQQNDGDRHSVASSDFERCSLDYEPSSTSSSSELDCSNSSEEELASINDAREEKRKRSQLSDDSSIFSDDDDDEVGGLFRGRTAEELWLQSLSAHLAEQPPPSSSVVAPFSGSTIGRGMSPRKRRRHDVSPDDVHAAVTQRPSLDFYKMQKTCIIRKNHVLNRPRVVKLRILDESPQQQQPIKINCDPSLFSFRSLSWTTPVVNENATSVASTSTF